MSNSTRSVTETHAGDQSVVTAVVQAVAAAEGRPTGSLPPLAHSINPDALTACIVDSNTDGYVAFDYCGHRVVVHTDRTVTVD
ncbi:HalOD1 output domain-containing protein [Haloarcula salina]|uniref:HalOD1 output domain-containing protein n=1 Tax=Haloarcula salina TaxID=1429914 RepID=UPI003C70452C